MCMCMYIYIYIIIYLFFFNDMYIAQAVTYTTCVIRGHFWGPSRHANARQVWADEVQEAHLGEWQGFLHGWMIKYIYIIRSFNLYNQILIIHILFYIILCIIKSENWIILSIIRSFSDFQIMYMLHIT